MSTDPENTRKPQKSKAPTSRSQRLASALKRNLGKRKAQQRARQEKGAAPSRE